MTWILAALAASLAFAQTKDLTTIAEKSGWKSTGRAVEVELLCKKFEKSFRREVKCQSYGKSPEGRDLIYITVGERSSKKPVVWVEAGIHAGEIDGKDAVFWLMKDAFEGKIENPFKNVTMVFVPIVNVDGHERFGKNNRPNQVGPEEMGWRVTSANLNMNRDFLKAETPEMRAMLKLWHRIDPVVSMDLHVTDGAHFQPEMGIIVLPTVEHGSSALHEAGKELEKGFMEKMKARGHLALPYYPAFEEEDRPETGFSRGVSTPRFSQGYWHAQNRIGVLVESHSWKDYATRVKAHYSAVLAALELAAVNGQKWKEAGKAKDKEALAGTTVPLTFKHTDKKTMVEFPGYEYKIGKSAVSGGEVISYNFKKKQIWKVPLYEELVPDITVKAPLEGYFVPPTHAKLVEEKLKLHGIKSMPWRSNAPESTEVFRATKITFAPTSFEGRQVLTVEGQWVKEAVPFVKGTLFVPINQPKAYAVMQILEPLAKDSLASWGFFNAHFERREYMENYVAEDVAKEMLKDPKIEAEFEERLKDKEFAKDPTARYLFFYRKHPSWDTKYGVYPIYRK